MAKTLKSTLSGAWLMQIVKMKVPVPCKIEYTVRHKGKGKNKLRFRFGSFYNLLYAKVHDIDIKPGKSKSRTTEAKKDNTGAEDGWQDVRWRLSRKALTKAIDWELTYTVTRLKGETDATNECDPTVTNHD